MDIDDLGLEDERVISANSSEAAAVYISGFIYGGLREIKENSWEAPMGPMKTIDGIEDRGVPMEYLLTWPNGVKVRVKIEEVLDGL